MYTHVIYSCFHHCTQGAMASSELRHKFMLEPASSFKYLNQSGCYTLEGVDDTTMFDQLRLALQVNLIYCHT